MATSFQLRLSTHDLDSARSVLQPLAETSTALSDDSTMTIRWEPLQVQRGALENLVALVGEIDFGSFGAGVVSSIVASWIWARFPGLHPKVPAKSPSEKLPSFKASIVRKETSIELDVSSAKALEASIRAALDDRSAS